MEINREYKFRGKCQYGNAYSDDGWIYGSLLYCDAEYSIVRSEDIRNSIEGYDFTSIPVIKETVGQYIGISINKEHPMYGDKIYLYEGDIISGNENCFPTKYVITFKDYKFVGLSDIESDFGKLEYDFSSIPRDRVNNLRLLGNIHDNPDMFIKIKKNLSF